MTRNVHGWEVLVDPVFAADQGLAVFDEIVHASPFVAGEKKLASGMAN